LRKIIRFEYKKSRILTIPENKIEKGLKNKPNNRADTERSRSYKTPSTKLSKSRSLFCNQLLFLFGTF
jgi:hypothetical protein